MAKKVVAAIRIKHNGEYTEPGKALDTSKFTKEDLTRLYERGAVKIVNPEEVEKQEGTLDDVAESGMAGQPSVPSMEDEQRAETKRAEAKDALRQKENDPNANK